ncbi:MAG: hypothetical protein ACYDGN_10280 [Acidimicrobiales bacterium]
MHRSQLGRFALVIGGLAAVVGLFILLEAASAHAFPPNSDGATVILEAQAMLHGKAMLQGWAISLDSFWTVDALWYIAGIVLYGLHPVLLYAVPAAIAVAVVVVGVVMATQERKGAAKIVAGAAVVTLLALPSHALAYFYLRGPLHVGTGLWCLVAFLCLRRGTYGWRWAVAVIFLAAGMLGDLQTLALGVVPIAFAGITAMARTREWRKGMPLVIAAAGSCVLAEVVRHLAMAIGTFSIAPANPIATVPQMIRNVKHGLHEAVLMMGVGSSYYGLGGEPTLLSYVHAIGLLVVLVGLFGTAVALVWGILRGRQSVVGPSSEAAWRLDDQLMFASFASPAAFLILAVAPDIQYARYLTTGIIFASILAARVLGRVVQQIRRPMLGRALAAVGLATTCCYAAGVGYNVSQPEPGSSAAQLATFLEAHHLYDGIGSYWSASIVTVESGGRVAVRPVISPRGHVLVRYSRNSAGYWYGKNLHFLVFQPGAPWGNVGWNTAINTFGHPSRVYKEGSYRIMVWNKALHVSPRGTTA